ncbi:tRNA guanosine(34) transglycosylase Tgt [Vampirovibrio sp.]|uniref:tRNA guanosine(34) transglycosylase Tgt n=1 Tax=Vampirovibrio sp. TaxID=2717857 RepID=UPI003593A525
MTAFSYQLQATQNNARAGLLKTPHGDVHTPVFMPVGTHSAVRTLTWPQVADTGAEIVLSNSYHLYLRPGHELVEKAGGLHQWMNWHKPILTDSGGFQVFSLAKHRDITPEGVFFKDLVDGKKHFMGPKESMRIQNALGADIIMAFDECPPGAANYDYAKKSLEMTNRWLETCFEHHSRPDQALFPIVQGSVYEDLRIQSVDFVSQFDAVGFAIGGVSVGETKMQMNQVVSFTAPRMPANKPRYLMGVGTPEDLLEGIRHGIDMFDCVMPTRVARHGSFFTPYGKKIIRNAEFKEDFAPLVEDCACYTCQNHSRAYLKHIYRMGETTAATLLSIHNIYSLVSLAQEARRQIIAGTFEDFYQERLALMGQKPSTASAS